MKVKITDIDSGDKYFVESIDGCVGEMEKSMYCEMLKGIGEGRFDAVMMGKTIMELEWDLKEK